MTTLSTRARMSIPPYTPAPYTPAAYGRSSSPLNPYPASSSPLTSPTPGPHARLPTDSTSNSRSTSIGYAPFQLHLQSAASSSSSSASASGPSTVRRPALSSRTTLPGPSFAFGSDRPTAPRSRVVTPPSRAGGGSGTGTASTSRRNARASIGPADLFTEGTTPMEGQMWRDRLGRRMAERDRRTRMRRADLARRRGTTEDLGDGADDDGMEEEERERQAREDDEEMYRRLMLLQRRRAEHAALLSHEQETGGSDPLLPEFWEDEQADLENEERALQAYLNTLEDDSSHYESASAHRAEWRDMDEMDADDEDSWAASRSRSRGAGVAYDDAETMEDDWIAQAAQAAADAEEAARMRAQTLDGGSGQEVDMWRFARSQQMDGDGADWDEASFASASASEGGKSRGVGGVADDGMDIDT